MPQSYYHPLYQTKMRANKAPVVMLSIIIYLDLSSQAMRLWEVVHRINKICKVYCFQLKKFGDKNT